jgi:hypothetical protein
MAPQNPEGSAAAKVPDRDARQSSKSTMSNTDSKNEMIRQQQRLLRVLEKEQRAREKLLNRDYGRRYVGYITNDRIMGVIRLPLDGNVYNSMGIIAHAGRVMDASVVIYPI